jgi:recombination protein RecT
MAKKAVLKNILSKWGMLSIEMQTAIQTDQAVIKNEVAEGAEINSETIEYADNQNIQDVEYKESEEVSTKLDGKFKKEEVKEGSKEDFKGTPLEDMEGDK